MTTIIKVNIILFALICSYSLQAQIHITGRVLSANDSLPLQGASIYFDGTSIGVSSGEDGRFSIKTENSLNSVLIINALGYKTQFFSNAMEQQNLGTIMLEESRESLGEVHLETDPWSREKKLNIFRREFLGNTPMARLCKIENEDKINLRYIPSTETLVAFADEPLKITNKYLGYEVTYNLTDFKVEFNSESGFSLTRIVYYEGYSFFQELRKRPRKRYLNNREETYNGSSLHFMRSLATRKLSEQGFRIFYNSFEVLPYAYFRIDKLEDLTRVEVLKEKLTIVYGPLIQSALHTTEIFYVDKNGNISPPQNVLFSGEMSKSRVAEMLPLNYNL